MKDQLLPGEPKRSRGRPRLQADPCTIRIGVPLTSADSDALERLVAMAAEAGTKVSKQEIIRQMIRDRASAMHNPLQD